MRRLFMLLLPLACGCAAHTDGAAVNAGAAQAAHGLDAATAEPNDRWRIVEQKLAKGVRKDDVYTVVIPRDFAVNHLDLGPVPVAAGIESSFHFFLCPCGKTSVIGQFVLQEHEINDVIDELRAAHMKVASVGAMMLNAQPRLYILRFHGEGDVDKLATTLNSALEWTGR